MSEPHREPRAVFRVIDALDAPHGGRIVRLRVLEGHPTVKELKGATLEARPPGNGDQRLLRVRNFAILGGRPSDRRIAQSKRCDLVIDDLTPGDDAVDVGWELRLPAT